MTTAETFRKVLKKAVPRALSTLWWILRITVLVSFIMLVLKYTGILKWIAVAVSPVFNLFGLPGDASLAYVSGYFINTYSCVAVISTLELTTRQLTILGTMTLAAHSMLLECAVQQKTGTSPAYIAIVRTLASFALGILLNLILPGRTGFTSAQTVALAEVPFISVQGEFLPMLTEWAVGMLKLALWMSLLIFAINILQRSLYEFGIMGRIARLLRPFLKVFGLESNTSFIWIVANVAGISYGSAAILEEIQHGGLSRFSINLLNTHIGISHSNLEDLTLLSATGGTWYVILLSRWILVALLVWILRLLKPDFLLGE